MVIFTKFTKNPSGLVKHIEINEHSYGFATYDLIASKKFRTTFLYIQIWQKMNDDKNYFELIYVSKN
jgi:hypothetical protein